MSETVLFRHRLEYLAFRAMMILFRVLPRRAAVATGIGLGLTAGSLLRIRRSVVDQNLEIAFGETLSRRERNRIARRTYAHFGAVFADALRIWARPLKSVESIIEGLDGVDYLKSVTAPHKGAAVIVTGHFGFWELGLSFPRRGFRVAPVVKPIHNPLIEGQIRRARDHENHQTVSTRGSMRSLVKRAREGWLLLFAADQDARKDGLFIEFMGRLASTHSGPAAFAIKIGLPMVPAFAYRQANGLYRIVFEEAIPQPEGVDEQTAIEAMIQQQAGNLERWIRKYPEQYWWFHRRWKTRPPGEKKSAGGVSRENMG